MLLSRPIFFFLPSICFVELESAVCVERAVQDLDGASVGNQQNLAVRKADAPKPKQKPQKAGIVFLNAQLL